MATERIKRQASWTFAVGMRRRTPLGRSASIGAECKDSLSARRTLTGKNVDVAGEAGVGLVGLLQSPSRCLHL